MWAMLSCLGHVDASPAVQATLEPCVSTLGSVMQNCSLRFAFSLTVSNARNSSLLPMSYSVISAVDDTGHAYDLVDTLDITVVKSGIEIHYPLTYERQFNALPYEVSLFQDASGRNFHPSTNPCVSSATSIFGACGWVIDASGDRVLDSNVSEHYI